MTLPPVAAFSQLNSAMARVAGLLTALRDGTIDEAECSDAMGPAVCEAAVAWAHLAAQPDVLRDITSLLVLAYTEGK